MRRFSFLAIGVALLLTFGSSACGGSKKTTPTATQVILGPSSLSLIPGATAQLSVNVEDANNSTTGISQTVTYNIDKPGLVSVANNGLVCAGTWDSTTTPVVCCPGTFNTSVTPAACVRNPQLGTAAITATSTNNITSAPISANVHQQVDTIVIKPSSASDFSSPTACQSIGEKNTYTAVACSGSGAGTGGCSKGTDVTPLVGTFTWTVPGAVASADSSCSTSSSPSSCVFTAAIPGQGQVTAAAAGIVSGGVPFTTCPVTKIAFHDANGSTAPVTIANAGTVTLTADVTDSKGTAVGVSPLFINPQPLATTVAPSTNTITLTGQSAGLSAIVAACAPPLCNANLFPVFSNAFDVTVSGTSATTTVYAASTSGTSLVPIDSGSNAAAAAITLPSSPNSMMFHPNGSKLYLGSATADLMVVDTASKAVTTVSGALGKVLAVSPDGTTVLTATATNVYIAFPLLTSGTNVLKQSFANATGAAFSPDYQAATGGGGSNPGAGRIYVVGADKLLVYQTNKVPQVSTIGAVNDVDFLRQGSFAYTAGGAGPVTVIATCNNANVGTVSAPASPQLIRALPQGTGMVAAQPPNLDVISATTDGAGCPPTVSNTVNAVDLGVGAYTPRQLIVSPTGNRVFVSSDKGLIAFNVGTSAVSTISLAGGTPPTTGGMTLDGNLLFVGSGSVVHKIDANAGTDTAQIGLPFNADLIAVQPK